MAPPVPRNEKVGEVQEALKDGSATVAKLKGFKENISALYVNVGNREAETRALQRDLSKLAKILVDEETDKKALDDDVRKAQKELLDELRAPRAENNYISVEQFDSENGERTVDGTVRATVHTIGAAVNDAARSLHEKTGWNETGIKIGLYATGAGVAYWLVQELLDTKVGKAIAGAVAGTAGFSFLPESFRDSVKDGFFSMLPESWVPFLGGEKWQMEKLKKTEKQLEEQTKKTNELIPQALPVLDPAPANGSVVPGRGDALEVTVQTMVQSIEAERALIKKIPEKRRTELNLQTRTAQLDATMLRFKPYLDRRQVEEQQKEATLSGEIKSVIESLPTSVNLLAPPTEKEIAGVRVKFDTNAIYLNGAPLKIQASRFSLPFMDVTLQSLERSGSNLQAKATANLAGISIERQPVFTPEKIAKSLMKYKNGQLPYEEKEKDATGKETGILLKFSL